jgi:hypothetical protein
MSMPGLNSTAHRLFIGGFAAALFVELRQEGKRSGAENTTFGHDLMVDDPRS